MAACEHWWNGLWGPQAKQDVFLYRETDRWTVEHRRRDVSRFWHCAAEAPARAIIEGLLAAGPGDWRLIAEEPGPADAQ